MGRWRDEDGLGLVEILVAMVLLSIGIMAAVASFSAVTHTTARASQTSQGASLADTQMEELRAGSYEDVWCPGRPVAADAGAPAAAAVCTDVRPLKSADGRNYQVETSVGHDCAVGALGGTVPDPTCSGTPAARPTKLVTIVVRSEGRVLHRQTSTFDRALGE